MPAVNLALVENGGEQLSLLKMRKQVLNRPNIVAKTYFLEKKSVRAIEMFAILFKSIYETRNGAVVTN